MSIQPKIYQAPDQRGIVSITVTLVFIMVITLIVLGFSQVTQRNGKLALDRELSAKAQNAADVGINDTMNQISEYIDNRESFDDGKLFPQQDTCEGTDQHRYNRKGPGDTYGVIYDDEPDVRYTCLLVSEPPDLRADNVGSESLVWPLDAANDEPLGQIKLEWNRAPGTAGSQRVSDCTTGGIGINQNIAANDWAARCQFGVLRVDIVPDRPSTVGSALAAAGNTMTSYIYPKEGQTVDPGYYSYVDPGVGNMYGTTVSQGRVGYSNCNEDTCYAIISGLDFEKAYIRVSSKYQNASSVRIERFNLDGSTSSGLEKTQVLIDVTGKAQDVLWRVQARVSITGNSSSKASNYFSDYGLHTADSICKRFNTSPRVGAQADVPSASGCAP